MRAGGYSAGKVFLRAAVEAGKTVAKTVAKTAAKTAGKADHGAGATSKVEERVAWPPQTMRQRSRIVSAISRTAGSWSRLM